MSRTRSIPSCLAVTLGLLAATSMTAPPATGQPSPANMRSGVATGTGQSGVAAFTVPGDQYFVLTDFDWNPSVTGSGDFIATITIYSGMSPRWSRLGVSQAGILFYPSFHNTTGIVFTPRLPVGRPG